MNPWHLDRGLLRRYEAGHTDLPLAGSIESHLISCGTCRQLAGGAVSVERLASIWQSIEAEIDAPQPTVLQRILRRLGFTHLAVTLVYDVTKFSRPSLRVLGTMASVTLLLVIATWMATPSTPDGSNCPVWIESDSACPAGLSPGSGPPTSATDLPDTARTLVDRCQGGAGRRATS